MCFENIRALSAVFSCRNSRRGEGKHMNFKEYIAIAKAQAAADYGIEVPAFDGGVHVIKAKPYGAHAIKTKTGTPFLDMISFGGGVVAVADESIVEYVTEYLSNCVKSPFRAFDAPNVFKLNEYLSRHGYAAEEMVQGFLPSRLLSPRTAREITILSGDEINMLYEFKDFSEALCYSTAAPRRDEIAAVYYDRSRPVGVAGCSNDSENMYQIGVDVLPEYRRRGIASELVKKLTVLIAEKGICPYYRCAWSNIASRRTAISCGYSDAWVELSYRPIKNSDL